MTLEVLVNRGLNGELVRYHNNDPPKDPVHNFMAQVHWERINKLEAAHAEGISYFVLDFYFPELTILNKDNALAMVPLVKDYCEEFIASDAIEAPTLIDYIVDKGFESYPRAYVVFQKPEQARKVSADSIVMVPADKKSTRLHQQLRKFNKINHVNRELRIVQDKSYMESIGILSETISTMHLLFAKQPRLFSELQVLAKNSYGAKYWKLA